MSGAAPRGAGTVCVAPAGLLAAACFLLVPGRTSHPPLPGRGHLRLCAGRLAHPSWLPQRCVAFLAAQALCARC